MNNTGDSLFQAKWSRTNSVSTDPNEQKFIDANPNQRNVRERYTYYYTVVDIEKIINEWKNHSPSSGISIKHQIHQIPNADLYKLLPSNQIGNIHQLTISWGRVSAPKRALFVGGTHAREVASVSAMIAFVDWLLENNQGIASKILERWTIDVVLLMNPLGYYIDNSQTVLNGNELVNKAGIYHRKNDRGIKQLSRPRSVQPVFDLDEVVQKGDCGADIPSLLSHGSERGDDGEVGVDLNRNSGMDFWCDGKRSNGWVSTGRGETYPGPSANSEPEIQIFQKIFALVNPNLFITLHGFGNLIVTSDVYDDTHRMNQEQLHKLKQSGLRFDRRKSVASPYTLTQLLGDLPFFQKITQDVKVWRNSNTREINEKINFPLEVCPLGAATGDMTFWSYCWRAKMLSTTPTPTPYVGFTLELGNERQDLFYPNKYQMIDVIHNSRTILTNALNTM